MENLITRISAIESRNDKVARDKAWETSLTRRASVAIVTYICACIVFIYLIPQSNWWVAAIVPTMGYILSTLGLPLVRRVWEMRRE